MFTNERQNKIMDFLKEHKLSLIHISEPTRH